MSANRPVQTQSGPERQITSLGVAFAVCMVVAAGMLGYWGLIRGPELSAREDNPRWIERERRIRRGSILDRYGRPLAQSEPGPIRTWERVYPAPEAAPVVGYASIHLGTGGIEDAYNVELRGELPGDEPDTLVQRIQAELVPRAREGVSVTLTLDRDLQAAASEALDGQAGAVVLLDVHGGDVLAMVSQPSYDPSQIEEQWSSLAYGPDKPMLNRAAQGLYPPGAIFQTVTLAAALQQDMAQPDTAYTDETGIVLTVDPPLSCPGEPPAVSFTLSEAYRWPCSVLFARLGLEMGSVRLADAARQLGIGQSDHLPIEVATGERLQSGLWDASVTGRTAMGRGDLLVTPLDMALVMATIANGGQRPAPRLVVSVGQEPGPDPAFHSALNPTSARRVGQVLVDAYQEGVAGTGLPRTGVAGTAREVDPRVLSAPDHAWFVGYAPADAPQFAVAVIVEHGEDGWDVAAPIGVHILQRAQQME
jgi:peptidoglycan glycosyltransferase